MTAMLSAFLKDESAATAIEYALIAAGIAIAIIGAVGGAGDAIKAIFTTIKEKLT
jgi:pilus assembly protein Flp/PilA